MKDINFTINIIELSYYRTIDTLNQSKMLPWYEKEEASPSPSKGGDVPNPTYDAFIRFKLYPIRTSPPLEGLGEAFFFGGGASYPACGPGFSSLPSTFGSGAGVGLFFLAGLSTDTSAA